MEIPVDEVRSVKVTNGVVALGVAWDLLYKISNTENTMDDEICGCGHSKGYHKDTAIDIHGGECEHCLCKLYTWKYFVDYLEVKK